MFNLMPPSMFTVSDIYHRNMVLSKPISNLFSDRISIGIAKKQDLLTHFGDANFNVMHNVIPFRTHYITPFTSMKSTHSC